MKTRLFLLITLLIINIFQTHGQVTKDAFILVDVSGTMTDANINREAKGMIKEMLTGNFNLQNHPGWDVPAGNRSILNVIQANKPILTDGSFLALIPFGNKQRYLDTKKIRFQNFGNEFENFYTNNYSFSYSDGLTFLTLAKAYAGSIANAENIRYYYQFVITDNQDDHTGSIAYTDFENGLMNTWNVDGRNRNLTICIFQKKTDKWYKIFIDSCEYCLAYPQPYPILKIISPVGYQNKPFPLGRNAPVDIKWECKSCINSDYQVIIKGPNTTKSFSINSVSFKFQADTMGLYSITVKNGGLSDVTYINVGNTSDNLEITGTLGKSLPKAPMKIEGNSMTVTWSSTLPDSTSYLVVITNTETKKSQRFSVCNSKSKAVNVGESGSFVVVVSANGLSDTAWAVKSGSFPWLLVIIVLLGIAIVVAILRNLDKIKNLFGTGKKKKKQQDGDEDTDALDEISYRNSSNNSSNDLDI